MDNNEALKEILKSKIEESIDQPVKVFTGIEPKVKCKNKILQNTLVKLFGYRAKYEIKRAKVITIKPDECPYTGDPITEICFKNN